jgi:hypothetical protein
VIHPLVKRLAYPVLQWLWQRLKPVPCGPSIIVSADAFSQLLISLMMA